MDDADSHTFEFHAEVSLPLPCAYQPQGPQIPVFECPVLRKVNVPEVARIYFGNAWVFRWGLKFLSLKFVWIVSHPFAK